MKIIYKIIILICIIIITDCGQKKEEPDTVGGNTPPFVSSVSILPEHPRLGTRVNLRIEAGDNEGDKINHTVTWFLNDEEIGKGLEFYLQKAKKGDKLYVEVIPDDGKLTGDAVKSSVIFIANTPPNITSATIKPDTILTSTDKLTVKGEGFDPDDDPIRWLCYWVLDYSERIADSSTSIDLQKLNLKKGSHLTAELYAYDGDTVSMPYLLEIDVVNAPPMLKHGIDSIPYKAAGLYYELPIIDPDGDPLTFEILQGPYGLKIDKERGVLHGEIQDTTTFEITVRATDSYGDYLEVNFTITPP